jgi:hypothetical protein
MNIHGESCIKTSKCNLNFELPLFLLLHNGKDECERNPIRKYLEFMYPEMTSRNVD